MRSYEENRRKFGKRNDTNGIIVQNVLFAGVAFRQNAPLFFKNRLTFRPAAAIIIKLSAIWQPRGGVAHLGERLNGIQEVRGSIPLISTTKKAEAFASAFLLFPFLLPRPANVRGFHPLALVYCRMARRQTARWMPNTTSGAARPQTCMAGESAPITYRVGKFVIKNTGRIKMPSRCTHLG